jgi:hypothetical protein
VEGSQRLVLQAPITEIVARRLGLRALPQGALIERRGPREQLVQAFPAPASLLGLGVLLHGLERDPEAVGQRLQRTHEVKALGLHHVGEGVATGLAAEAVVEPFVGADVKGPGPLVMKRAVAEVAVDPGAAQIDPCAHEAHHVDRLKDAVARIGGPTGHGATNASGTVRSS